MSQRPKRIYVVGLDDFNRKQLERLPEAEGCEIRAALLEQELKAYGETSIRSMLDLAHERMNAAPPDAIMTWWDFPGTLLTALLKEHYGLNGPDLSPTLKCEHKYWSRIVQQEAAPEVVPRFDVLDPFNPPRLSEIQLERPFWFKPVKGTDSMLGFKIESEADYDEALTRTREKIKEVAEPFNEILKRADLPPEIRSIDGSHCILEESCCSTQHTVSGYVQDDRVHLYGVVDSLNYPGTSSFQCYLHPSQLDNAVRQRMKDVSEKIIRHIGLKHSAFNIEYFYDADTDHLCLLEINPRISQSHADIYLKTDGKSNEGLILELALGKEPEFPRREGMFGSAGMFYHRHFEDGVVKRVPHKKEIHALKEKYPDLLLHIEVEEGARLSELHEQDSYSYVLAVLFIGAESATALREKYEEIVQQLNFRVAKV